METQNIKDVLDAMFGKLHMDSPLRQEKVKAAYFDVVGELISKMTVDLSYNTQFHVLYVFLRSAALRQELTYKTTDLIAAINRQLGMEEVKKIVFK